MAFNDVVRHVILKIVVDQEGLAESLAKARERLKALEQAEKSSNASRAKDAEKVTKAHEAQTDAIEKNIAASERHAAASNKDAEKTSQHWKDATQQVKDNTAAQIASSKAMEDAADRANKRQIATGNAEAKRIGDAEKQRLESAARIGREQQRLNQDLAAKQHKINDDEDLREATRFGRQLTQLHELTEARRKATAQADHSVSVASSVASYSDAAKTFAGDASDAAERAAIDRRQRGLREARRGYEELNNVRRAGNVLEQRAAEIAERRVRSADRETRIAQAVSRRRGGFRGGVQAAGSALQDAAVIGVRSVTSAPKSFRRGMRQDDNQPELSTLSTTVRDLRKEATSGEKALASFFGVFRRDGGSALSNMNVLRGAFKDYVKDVKSLGRDANPFSALRRDGSSSLSAVQRVRAGVSGFFSESRRGAAEGEKAIGRFWRSFKGEGEGALRGVQRLNAGFKEFLADLNRARVGGDGGSLFKNFGKSALSSIQQLGNSFNGLTNHFFSIRTLVVAVIAAFGPLAAILGGVGAAALGLISNLGALSGSLLALPGLIGAAVGAFGALAIVMKPLSGVFSAFSAKQKEATDITKKGTTAALDYQLALLNQQQAELAHTRAIQDVPRAQLKLNDARKQAARDIQDYRLQLQKLKFDEEGAKLGVLGSEQDYRRALADPTASKLDRQMARHSLEGSLFDQRDQKVAGGRLLEDSKEAFKKGVEGSDAVIEAQRAVVDATNNVTASYIAWQKSILEVAKAAKIKEAGGTAAAQLQAELDKLPPKTRKVAQAILDLNKSYKAMRDRLSENIFGPVSGETSKFADLLKSLEAFLGPTSVAIGKFAKNALDLFTNPAWKDFFSKQGEESGYIIEQLGDALLSTADAFRNITEVARPFTRFVVDGIKGMAGAFDDFAKSDKGRAKIAGFLDLTKQRMQELWPVIKNLAGGFAGFFAALNTAGGGKDDFTTWFNKGLLNASKTFKALGDQARDPNSGFQKWLRDVRPLLSDIVGFLKGAGKFFGDLFSDTDNMSEASKILKEISSQWLPRLADIFDQLSQSGLISKLAAGISGVFGAVQDFLKNGGVDAIGNFADKLELTGDILSGLIGFLSKIPGLLTVIAGTAAFVLGAAFVAKFSGLSLLFKTLLGGFRAVRDIVKSIKNPANIPTGDADDPNTKPAKPGTIGPTGKKGSTASTGGGVGKPGKTKKPSKLGKLGGKLGGLFGGNNTSKPGGITQGIRNAAKDAITGDNQPERRLSRIEAYARQIEINTRRYGGGSTSSRPGGGTGGSGGGGTRSGGGRNTPILGGGGATSQPNLRNAAVRDAIRNEIDPRSTTPRTEGTTARVPGDRRNVTTSSYSDERIAQNERRKKVGLKPLPPDVTSTPERDAQNERRKTVGLKPIPANEVSTSERDAQKSRRTPEDGSVSDHSPIAAGPVSNEPGPNSRAQRQIRNRAKTAVKNQAAIDAAQAIADAEQAERDAAAAAAEQQRTRRSHGGTQSPTQKRQDVARRRYDRRNASLTEARPDLPLRPNLTSAIDQSGGITGRPAHYAAPGKPVLADTVSQRTDPTSTLNQSGGITGRPAHQAAPGKPVLADTSDTRLPTVNANPTSAINQSGGITGVPAHHVAPGKPVLADVSDTRPGEPTYTPVSKPVVADVRDTLPALPARGLNDNVHVPTRDEIVNAPQPRIKGRFAKKPKVIPNRQTFENFHPYSDDDLTPEPAQTRNASGQFQAKPPRKPVLADVSTVPPEVITPRRTATTTVRTPSGSIADTALPDPRNLTPVTAPAPTPIATPSPRRTRTTTLASDAPNLDVLSDIINGGDGSGTAEARPPKKGFFRKIVDRHRDVMGSDEGSAVIGGVPFTRRDKTTRPKRKRFGKGARGAGVTGIATAVLGDDEYEEGYEDGLAAGGGGGGGGGLDLPDTDHDGKDKDKGRRGRSTTVEGDIVDEDEPTRRGRRGTVDTNEPSRGRRGTVIDGEATETSRSRPSRRRGGRGGRAGGRGGLGRSLGRGLGGKLGGLARGLGGGLLRGAAGGIGGLVAGAAASLGGDYLINKFVKNDNDASSLQRGMGAVANGAGIGASIGSIIPGVGTVIGGAVGGLAGGAYSLFKDKNLRSFVGGKLGGAAKSVGGFLKGAGGAVSGALGGMFGGLFGGKKDDEAAAPAADGTPRLRGSGSLGPSQKMGVAGTAGIVAALGPVGGLVAKTDIGANIIQGLARATNTVKTFFGKTVPEAFERGFGKFTGFFTKTIPDAFETGVKGIKTFFTKTLPGLPKKAINGIIFAFGFLFEYFTVTMPHAMAKFFTKDIPNAAKKAWHWIQDSLWNPFMDFVKSIPGFFTETIPHWFESADKWLEDHVRKPVRTFVTQTIPHFFKDTIPKWFVTADKWIEEHVRKPVRTFVTETIPNFFTDTIPKWFKAAPEWFNTHVIKPITDFFTVRLPKFFTEDIPNAIKAIPDFVMNTLVKPVVDFFSGVWDHIKSGAGDIWGWAKGLFSDAGKSFDAGKNAAKPHMSGGLIEGVYQGIQDTAHIMATPGEFMVRKSRVDEPGAKAFLREFNEKGMASMYSGLSASAAPQVMSMVPPEARNLTGSVPTIVNNTVNHAPLMGDVTIHNPVRERSEHSLRRQVQIANIRHRR